MGDGHFQIISCGSHQVLHRAPPHLSDRHGRFVALTPPAAERSNADFSCAGADDLGCYTLWRIQPVQALLYMRLSRTLAPDQYVVCRLPKVESVIAGDVASARVSCSGTYAGNAHYTIDTHASNSTSTVGLSVCLVIFDDDPVLEVEAFDSSAACAEDGVGSLGLARVDVCELPRGRWLSRKEPLRSCATTPSESEILEYELFVDGYEDPALHSESVRTTPQIQRVGYAPSCPNEDAYVDSGRLFVQPPAPIGYDFLHLSGGAISSVHLDQHSGRRRPLQPQGPLLRRRRWFCGRRG